LMPKQGSSPQFKALSVTLDMTSKVFTSEKSSGELTWLSFTTLRALQDWSPEGRDYTLMTGQEICLAALRNNISSLFISSGKDSGELHRNAIEALAEGSVFESLGENSIFSTRLPEKGSIETGVPSDLLEEPVLSRLKSILATLVSVEEAYLAQLKVGDGKPHVTLGIKFGPVSEQKMKAIFDKTLSEIQPLIGKGEFWDIFPLETGSELSEKIIKAKNKIYSSI
jgi:SseB protein C-terminal domain